MSIMSGLVETGTEMPVAPRHSEIGAWMERNAWGLILGSSLVFWLAVGSALILG